MLSTVNPVQSLHSIDEKCKFQLTLSFDDIDDCGLSYRSRSTSASENDTIPVSPLSSKSGSSFSGILRLPDISRIFKNEALNEEDCKISRRSNSNFHNCRSIRFSETVDIIEVESYKDFNKHQKPSRVSTIQPSSKALLSPSIVSSSLSPMLMFVNSGRSPFMMPNTNNGLINDQDQVKDKFNLDTLSSKPSINKNKSVGCFNFWKK